ncbi:MAG: phage holin family protein [Acidobacteria bacterium]|nr:phage holin family protein [Acidobacteriota bacterium]
MLQHQERGRFSPSPLQRESIGDLLSNLAIHSANLVQDGIALMGREIYEKGKNLQSVLIIIAVGAALALIAVITLCAAIVLALSEYFEPWLSALLVGGVLGAIATAVITTGLSRLRGTSLKPEKSIETLEENKEWLKEIT